MGCGRAPSFRTPIRCVTIPRPHSGDRRTGICARPHHAKDRMSKIKVDMHTHSEYSPDSRTPLASQAAAIKAAGLNVVCATDHNTVEGALRLREIADGFRVIVGEEISSADGEIIGLFLETTVPRGLSAEETIARIREQGGIVSIPHPFSHNRIHHIRSG